MHFLVPRWFDFFHELLYVTPFPNKTSLWESFVHFSNFSKSNKTVKTILKQHYLEMMLHRTTNNISLLCSICCVITNFSQQLKAKQFVQNLLIYNWWYFMQFFRSKSFIYVLLVKLLIINILLIFFYYITKSALIILLMISLSEQVVFI